MPCAGLKIENVWHNTVGSFIIELRKSPYSCCAWIRLTQLYVVQTPLRVAQLCRLVFILFFVFLETRWRLCLYSFTIPGEDVWISDGCSLSSFYIPPYPLILWTFLWRYNLYTGLLWMIHLSWSWKNPAILLVSLLFTGLHLLFTTPFQFSSCILNMVHGYILGWNLDVVAEILEPSPEEMWDGGGLSPFTESPLMSHFCCRQDEALYIIYRNSPLDSADHWIEIP